MGDRFPKDSHVGSQADGVKILKIKGDLFLVGQQIPTVDLRQSRNPRAKAVDPLFSAKLMRDCFLGDQRARTDQTHVALEYVPKLWKLVKACAAQDAPDGGDQFLGIFQLCGGAIGAAPRQ